MIDLLARSRLARFVIVGVGVAALLFVLTYVFAITGMPPFAGNVLAYVIAFIVAYTAHSLWTFDAHHGHRRSLPRYFVVQFACALFSGVSAHIMVVSFGVRPAIMAAVTTIGASAVSYFLSSFWAFADSPKPR